MSRQLAELSLYNYWTNTVQFWTQKIQIKIWIFFRTSNNGATSLCIVSRQLRFTSDYFPISVYKLTNSQGGNSMNKSTTHLYFTFYLPNPPATLSKVDKCFRFQISRSRIWVKLLNGQFSFQSPWVYSESRLSINDYKRSNWKWAAVGLFNIRRLDRLWAPPAFNLAFH